MRHGVPERKMKDDLLRSYISYKLLTGRSSSGHILLKQTSIAVWPVF